MTQTQTIPETFLGVGYTRDRAGLPLEAVRVPVPQPAADEVLILNRLWVVPNGDFRPAEMFSHFRRSARRCHRRGCIGALMSRIWHCQNP